MKKIRGILVIASLIAVLCISAFAAEKTVYISSAGNDAASGATYSEAVKTFEAAYKLIGNENGKIVVCNYMNIGAYTMPAHSGTVTVTASDGKNFFPLGKLAVSGTFSLSGDTVFDRISLSASGSTVIAACGNDLTFGERVETTGTFVIFGGYNVTPDMTAESVSIVDDYTITIGGGEFSYVRGGNRRADGKSPFGTISGNCTINIIGGELTAKSSATNTNAATGMNIQTGNVIVNISGGAVAGNFYAVGRAGTNNTDTEPTVTGNITVNVTGGTIGGKVIAENQDNTVAFGGKYTLNLADGQFPNIEEISGGNTAVITVSDILKTDRIVETEYKNPLMKAPDPWVTFHDGYYYSVSVQGTSIKCYKSTTLNGLAYADGVTIWSAPAGNAVNATNKHYSQDIWSPELHYIEESEFGAEMAGWWLYFAADDGNNVNHRLFTVRALTEDALGKYGSPVTGEEGIPAKMTVDNDKTWAIGQSLLRANGVTYLTWTSEDGRSTSDHHQEIRIAKLANPYTIEGKSSIICEPEYDWEAHGYAYNAGTGASYPKVVEGATAIYGDNGEVVITYSASGYWKPHYCIATLTLRSGADPMNKDSWVKSAEPAFKMQNGLFGPGHAAFTTDANGNRFMMYHTYLNYKCEDNGRYVFIQPWEMNGAEVDMNGGPYSQDTVLTVYNNCKSLEGVISGFAK